MGFLTKPAVTQIITQNGECKILLSIELNLNINNDNITITQNTDIKPVDSLKNENEDVGFVIPDFSSQEKLKFGKEV